MGLVRSVYGEVGLPLGTGGICDCGGLGDAPLDAFADWPFAVAIVGSDWSVQFNILNLRTQ